MSSSSIQDNGDDDIVRPFEWLTSPESLLPLLREAFSETHNNNNHPQEQHPPSTYNVLHVGSGGSVLGEYLVENEDKILPKGSQLGQVVNIDRDQETLALMQTRWQRQLDTHCITQEQFAKVRYETNDLVVQQGIPFPDESFQVILDKSTLDCTLCSDTATAWLLHEVYRLLDQKGGVYVLISFHHLELLLPLLQECPGCSWTITHSTMERQVEDLISPPKKKQEQEEQSDAKQQQSSSANTSTDSNIADDSHKDERKQLRILLARRIPTDDTIISTSLSTPPPRASVQEICDHVHHTNDSWYKTQHPILTPERCHAIQQEFERHGPRVSLETCFSFLFTDAEREHLTYEYFLEDWEAFLSSHASAEKDCMTLDVALTFLEEMQ